MRAEQRAAVENGRTIDPKRVDEMLRRFSDQAGEMAAVSSGADRAMAEANQALTQALLAAKQSYNAAVAQLGGEKFWELSTLTKKEEIAHRRMLVQKFATAAEAVAALQRDDGAAYRRELEVHKMPSAAIEDAVNRYRAALAGSRGAAMIKLREIDGRYAAIMLEFLDFAEMNLGKWKVETDNVVFAEGKTEKSYNEIRARVNALADEQERYRRQLAGAK